MGVDKPNYTQIPNLILDDIMRYMDGAELKVTLAIARHTFGYHRERVELTITEIEGLTGLSRPAVTGALDVGIRRNLIERIPAGNRSYAYALVVNDEVLAIGKESLPIKEDSQDIGKENLPASVKKVYHIGKESLPISVKKVTRVTPTLKKELKKVLKKERESNGTDVPVATPPKHHPAIVAYRDLHNRFPSTAQMKIISERNPPVADWVRAIRVWAERGFKPTNIEGMLDWAFNPNLIAERGYRNDNRSTNNGTNAILDYAKSKEMFSGRNNQE